MRRKEQRIDCKAHARREREGKGEHLNDGA
jgi:hypothetical protein